MSEDSASGAAELHLQPLSQPDSLPRQDRNTCRTRYVAASAIANPTMINCQTILIAPTFIFHSTQMQNGKCKMENEKT